MPTGSPVCFLYAFSPPTQGPVRMPHSIRILTFYQRSHIPAFTNYTIPASPALIIMIATAWMKWSLPYHLLSIPSYLPSLVYLWRHTRLHRPCNLPDLDIETCPISIDHCPSLRSSKLIPNILLEPNPILNWAHPTNIFCLAFPHFTFLNSLSAILTPYYSL